MQKAYIVTGTLTDIRTVTLDEALPLESAKVRLIIEPIETKPQRSYQEVIADIRKRQKDRNYRHSTKEEIDAYIQTERDSWER